MKGNFVVVVVSSLALIFALASLSFGANLSMGVPHALAVSGGSEAPSWVTAGAYLNYTANGGFGFSVKLSNGSSISYSGNVTGSVRSTVESVSNGEANVTQVPNLMLTETLHYFNGTNQMRSLDETPANSTSSSMVSLETLNFGNLLQEELNSINSSYSFSPNLNTSLTSAPGVLYNWNGQSVVAFHLASTVSSATSIPSTEGVSGTYTLSGSSSTYIALANDILLQTTFSISGSASISNLGLVQQSATGSGNAEFTITLASSNIDFSTGSSEQAVISVPSLSASIDVVSNSTINSAGTNGSELVVSVTGTSGTSGVMDVIVSSSMLQKAGITDSSQVSVTVDGQAYSNYTVSNLGGAYVFVIYYHHSSHNVALTFGSANLGTNSGTISSVSPTSTGLFGLSTDMLLIAVVVVVVVVAGLGYFFFARGRRSAAVAPPPPTSPTG
jgi:hypothetical protein